MAGKRWIRLDATWEESSWLFKLDAQTSGCWVRLLCRVKLGGLRGRIKRPATEVVASQWKVGPGVVMALEVAAIANGALAIEDGDWVVLKWAEYQEPDATTAKRSRKYRESMHRLSPSRRDTVTHAVTGCDPSMSLSVKDSGKKETTRKTKYLLPEEWQPSERHQARAMELGVDAVEEAEKMRDWALSGGQKRLDWDAQFRNWLRQAAERKKVVPIRQAGGITKEDVRILLVAAGDWVYSQEARQHALRDAADKHPETWTKCRRVMWNLNYGALNAVKSNDYQFNQTIDSEIARISNARNAG